MRSYIFRIILLFPVVLVTLRMEAKVIDDGPQHLNEMSSIGESLRNAGPRPVHILYVHGMSAMGAGDSWAFQKGICGFMKGCQLTNTPVPVKREYVDRGAFQSGANPPAFDYMGKPIWSNPGEWSASAPFVDHYVLARANGGPVVLDEVNWWPLVRPLKCRNIMPGEAPLAGPDSTLLNLCSAPTQEDKQNPGRFTSYQWISSEDAAQLKAMRKKGAMLNRDLKNAILDWGVSDSFMAVGALRPLFREAMRQLFVKSARFHADRNKTNDWQQKVGTPQEDDREYIVVSHSLGSYLVFSTLNLGGLDQPSTGQSDITAEEDAAARYILERTSLVYFFANQLVLLELANEESPQPATALEAQAKPSPGGALSKRLAAWAKLRERYRQQRNLRKQPSTVAPPQVIAWSDPSDLLTWHVPAIDGIKVDNVYVRNSWWHWLIAAPTTAHLGYATNKTVLRVLMRP